MQEKSSQRTLAPAPFRRIAMLLILTAELIATGCSRSVAVKEPPAASPRTPPAGFFQDVTAAKGLPAKAASSMINRKAGFELP